MKARQLGITWLVVAFCLWKTLFHGDVRILLISKDGNTAAKMIGGGFAAPGKAKYIYNHLPVWMRPKLSRDTQENMDFANGSSLEALSSEAAAGKGTDASIVVRDELEEHPYAESSFAAVGPCIDAGGQLIDLSTVNKRVSVERSHFKTRYAQAKSGKSNAYAIFLPWHLRPVRTQGETLESWFETIKRKYPSWQVEEQYPSSEKEALSTLESVMFFDQSAVHDMMLDILPPLPAPGINTYGNIVRVFKPPVVGEKYCIFTDPSDGKEDPFHTVVMKKSTGEGVCEASGKVTADICAQIHHQLVLFYNNAYHSYEVNAAAGGKFDETIFQLNTPNRAPRRDSYGKVQTIRTGDKDTLPQYKRGWYTTPPLKKLMIWGLEEAIRKHLITSHNQESLMQFQDFVLLEGEDMPTVPKGMHDDAIIAWAGVYQISKYVMVGQAFSIESTFYKD